MMSRRITSRRFDSINTPKNAKNTAGRSKPLSRVIDPQTEQFSRVETDPDPTYGYEYGTATAGDIELFNQANA